MRFSNVLLVCLLCVCGCHANYSNKQPTNSLRDPKLDLADLFEFGKSTDTCLYTPSVGETVTWEENRLFRVYIFKHHSLIIYPLDWTASNYNLILLAGSLYENMNSFDAINYHFYDDGPKSMAWNCGIDWKISESEANTVGFKNLHLGDPQQEIFDKQEAYFRSLSPDKELRSFSDDMLMMSICKGWSETYREQIHLGLGYASGRLAYIDIRRFDGPSLQAYELAHPSTPVLRRGSFIVSK